MRRCLVCVVGTQPQVVTLAFHHLCFSRTPQFPIDELYVITTQEGRTRLIPTLLDEEHGQFFQMLRDYGLKRSTVKFDESHVRVIRDQTGMGLNDIRTDLDNHLAADQISEMIRGLARDPDRIIHLCLADGRQPMSFYAGYALSLYARASDELSQVLVNDELSGHPEFYYPPPKNRLLLVPDEQGLFDTSKAEIVMGRVPFVRLRQHLPEDMLDQIDESLSLDQMVDKAQRRLDQISLRLDCREERVYLNGEELVLQPKTKAFLWFLALRRLLEPDDSFSISTRDSTTLFDEIYSEVDGAVIHFDPNDPGEFDPAEIAQLVSKIRSSIEKQFGLRLLERFGPIRGGDYGVSRYGLYGLKPEQIILSNDLGGKGLPCGSQRFEF